MLRAWALWALTVLLVAAAGASPAAQAQTVDPPEKSSAESNKSSRANAAAVLESASKALEAGKTDQTVQQINGLLSGQRLPGRTMARALYLRGAAYHRQGKPAQAIADLTSALWLKGGLSDADRATATSLRAEAYRAAGLNDLAEADARKAGQTSGNATATAAAAPERAERPRPSEPQPRTAAASQQQSTSPGSGVADFFSNLFGGFSAPSSSSGAAPASPRPDPYGAASAARQTSIGSAWSTSVEAKPAGEARQPVSVRQETAALPVKSEPVKPAATTPDSKAHGRYRLQVAAVRARSEAQALVTRIKTEYGSVLGGRELEVDQTVIGNMGTFYRVRIGPFADATETGPLCGKLRGIGLDCLIMAE